MADGLDRDKAMALAAVLGVGGVALLLWSLSNGGGGGGEESDTPVNGGTIGKPRSSLDASPVVNISIGSWANGRVGQVLPVTGLYVEYDNPGKGQDVFTIIQVKQNGIPVMASGIAGVFIGNPADPTYIAPNMWGLVAPDQPQPNADGSCPVWGQANVGQRLDAWLYGTYPGPFCTQNGVVTVPVPICGTFPTIGSADVHVQVYQCKYPNDGPGCPGTDIGSGGHDGFQSPSCARRKVLTETIHRGKVNFVA